MLKFRTDPEKFIASFQARPPFIAIWVGFDLLKCYHLHSVSCWHCEVGNLFITKQNCFYFPFLFLFFLYGKQNKSRRFTCFLISGCLQAISTISSLGISFQFGITEQSFVKIEITIGLGLKLSAICKQYKIENKLKKIIIKS